MVKIQYVKFILYKMIKSRTVWKNLDLQMFKYLKIKIIDLIIILFELVIIFHYQIYKYYERRNKRLKYKI